jgi:tetratricopeptide (TPR) repeat protein
METQEFIDPSPLFSGRTIKLRQDFYFLGRTHELAGNVREAIDTYKQYALHLKEEDRHIPYQWISDLHAQLGEEKEALSSLERFAEGCKPPRAEKVYREIGERYKKINDQASAESALQKAKELKARIPKTPAND